MCAEPFDGPTGPLVPPIGLDVDPGNAELLERMPEEEKFGLDVDTGALRRRGKPCPADLDGTWFKPTGPGSWVSICRTPHGPLVTQTDLRKRSELAALGLLELGIQILLHPESTRDPCEVLRIAILLGCDGKIRRMAFRQGL